MGNKARRRGKGGDIVAAAFHMFARGTSETGKYGCDAAFSVSSQFASSAAPASNKTGNNSSRLGLARCAIWTRAALRVPEIQLPAGKPVKLIDLGVKVQSRLAGFPCYARSCHCLVAIIRSGTAGHWEHIWHSDGADWGKSSTMTGEARAKPHDEQTMTTGTHIPRWCAGSQETGSG